MNHLTRSLAAFCREHLLDEKWLIAPALRIGHQWLEAVVRGGQPAVNVRLHTLQGLALTLAGPEMADKNLSLVTGAGATLLIDSILNGMLRTKGGYLAGLQPSPGLSQTVRAAIDALRLAGLTAQELRPAAFEVAAKAQDIARLLREYLARLQALGLVDYAGVLQMACSRLQNGPTPHVEDILIAIPEDAELTALERDLLGLVPQRQVHVLGVDQPLTKLGEPGEKLTDAALLRWLPDPAAAPRPKGDGSAALFRAIGEANEVREVLRRCLAMERPLDEVEVLHTDTETYVPLFYELAWRLQPETDRADPVLPITFAEGIPVRYSRPGRALLAWLAWIGNNYPQAAVVRMLQDGLLKVPDHDRQQFSFSRLAIVFRSIGIGLGRDRYLPKLAEETAACAQRLADPDSFVDEDGELDEEGQAAVTRRWECVRLLEGLMQDVLALTPSPAAAPAEILAATAQFLRQLARTVNESDRFAAQALVEEIEQMRRWVSQAEGDLSHDFWAWLAALADQVRIGGSGPRPGCLHVAHALSGGHSGRPVTFIVGLDDSRFPGAGLQDPLLLDQERRTLSPQLPTAADELKGKLQRFARLLARLRGHVTLSYCSHDLADDREMFPSPVILAAYRILSGKHDGDQSDLLQWLPPPASFAPQVHQRCLDEADWWLWRLCGSEPVAGILELATQHFPHLGRGRRADAHRAAEKFSNFDGAVAEAGADYDPTKPDGPVLSASSLEMIGRCPLAYFFHYVLRLEAPEELVVDPTRWLDPLAFGSLLHEVFRQFMTQLRSHDLLPKRKRDEKKLMAILDQQIALYRDRYPPPSASAFRAQCRQLQEAARIFLTGEEDFCQHSRPEFLEAALGMTTETTPTPLDEPEPIVVALPDGRSLRARGRIDRVDRIGAESAHEYAIWDYKTGGIRKKYRDKDPFVQGRLVQHAFYLTLAESVLKRKVHRKAIVKQAGYYFPTARGQGERLSRSREQLADGGLVLQRLCQIVANGAFLATNDAEDCEYCDYRLVCGDLEATAATSQSKLENRRNQALKPLRELRDDG